MPFVREETLTLALILVELEIDVGLYMRETVWILPGVRERIEKTTSLYERTGSI